MIGALVHAEHAELADERVDDDLEDMREDVLLRVRLGVEFRRRITRLSALALVEQRRVALQRIGRELDQHVQQLVDACTGARRREAHRNQMAFAQRLLERRVQLVGRDLVALLEVLRHQRLVDFDDLVDQRLVRIGDRREVGFPRRD